jgi:type I restriction-modification system DNA methylase subunit
MEKAREEKSKLGQFITPETIAKFMINFSHLIPMEILIY